MVGRAARFAKGSFTAACRTSWSARAPPLVVFSGLSPEHANPTGLARQFQLQTLKPFAKHFTVYAVNRKPGLPAGSTIKDLADHYTEAIAHQFPGPVCIEGISTGGSIAQQFAIDHPHLVRRLVLAATAAGGRALAALMWLFGGGQRAEPPSDMLVTIAAEDVFDAARSCTTSPPRPFWWPAVGTGSTPRSCSGRRPRASPTAVFACSRTRATPA